MNICDMTSPSVLLWIWHLPQNHSENGKEKFVLAGVEVELGMDNDKFECLESLPHY